MRVANGCMAIALMLGAAGLSGAQSTAKAAEPTQGGNTRPYRLVWTITETDAGKQVGTQHFAMAILSSGRTTMKLGSKVPVVTGSYSPNSTAAVQTQFQYIDVGLNIDANLDEVAGGLRLRSKVEQSSVADEKITGDVREPIIRQAVMEGTSVVSLNKPVRLGSLDVPGSTRHLDIEVELEDAK